MLQASPRMQATLEPRDKEDTSSVSSDKYEKDVNILNRNTQNLTIIYGSYWIVIVSKGNVSFHDNIEV